MMTRALTCLLLSLGGALCHAATPQTGDGALYFPCRSCHGDQGEGSVAIHAPALAGQDATYLARQLKHFRDGQRGANMADKYGRQMALMAANLSDTQIERVAGYIAGMPPGAPGVSNSTTDSLYVTCVACHGKNGAGKSALAAPRIAGLDSRYLATQLRHYRDGVRAYAADDVPGQQMRAAMGGLGSDADIDAVAQFVSGLSGEAD